MNIEVDIIRKLAEMYLGIGYILVGVIGVSFGLLIFGVVIPWCVKSKK